VQRPWDLFIPHQDPELEDGARSGKRADTKCVEEVRHEPDGGVKNARARDPLFAVAADDGHNPDPRKADSEHGQRDKQGCLHRVLRIVSHVTSVRGVSTIAALVRSPWIVGGSPAGCPIAAAGVPGGHSRPDRAGWPEYRSHPAA